MNILLLGKAYMYHWGEEYSSANCENGGDEPVILSLGDVHGVYGDIVIHSHENWNSAMFLDLSEADEWIFVEDAGEEAA